MKIKFNGKEIKINVKKVSELGKITGLMFKSPKYSNLLFEFKKTEIQPIHSLFVFFSFLAVWLDDKNQILDIRLVKPFRPSVKSRKPFRKLIELPLNDGNKSIIELLVGKRKDLNMS